MTPRELKPCPFCGSEGEYGRGPHGERMVRCSNENCDAGLGPGYWQTTDEDAARAWNTRAALPEQPLSKEWREQADEHDRAANNMGSAMYGGIQAAVLRGCADDLDAQHDQDRELLREAVRLLDIPKPNQVMERPRIELASRIRKHLENQP